jgi:hypothetical protein
MKRLALIVPLALLAPKAPEAQEVIVIKKRLYREVIIEPRRQAYTEEQAYGTQLPSEPPNFSSHPRHVKKFWDFNDRYNTGGSSN